MCNYEKIKIEYSDAVSIAVLSFYATDSWIVPLHFESLQLNSDLLIHLL
jgi:hypothetical protein